MKKMLCILASLMFLVSAMVASFGSICIDNNGLHVDVSALHGCCKSESLGQCATDNDCFDLSVQFDASRQTHQNDGLDVTLSQTCIAIISYVDRHSIHSGFITKNPAFHHSAANPLAAIQSIRMLV